MNGRIFSKLANLYSIPSHVLWNLRYIPSGILLLVLQVDPLAPNPLPSALLEQYQLLVKQEEECQQAIRDIEWEISEISHSISRMAC